MRWLWHDKINEYDLFEAAQDPLQFYPAIVIASEFRPMIRSPPIQIQSRRAVVIDIEI